MKGREHKFPVMRYIDLPPPPTYRHKVVTLYRSLTVYSNILKHTISDKYTHIPGNEKSKDYKTITLNFTLSHTIYIT